MWKYVGSSSFEYHETAKPNSRRETENRKAQGFLNFIYHQHRRKNTSCDYKAPEPLRVK